MIIRRRSHAGRHQRQRHAGRASESHLLLLHQMGRRKPRPREIFRRIVVHQDSPPRPARRADQVVTPQAKSTTETELTGISTAHVNGESRPDAAMPTPIKLYAAEIPKLTRTTRADWRASAMISTNRGTCAASRITSLAAENAP